MPEFGNDRIQFTRLLAELYAAGIPQETIDQAAASMDLEPAEVQEILARADRDWERAKDRIANPPAEEEKSATDEYLERTLGQRWAD